ncbi:MAG: bifunctional nicotinamidase/pyrazinamidase [Verrucomicrobia bacterium]|nr:bifunctional nicotinamidase/pyrazinamidase [Verrucomicrobiota bacterium]MBV9645744.1 bifunctional nicotinamidase/pyrazinamidase [Verrucomicrobiota bacterium]
MDVLLVVDIQNDFLPGGALGVPEGDLVIPVINRLMDRFVLVLATQDWHPANHGSFAANHPNRQPGEVIDLNGIMQILWPVHCVQGSSGAAFSTRLHTERFAKVFQKGIDPEIDSYSSFFDNARRRSTGLIDYLRERNVGELFICGLATDYCVRFSALDSIQSGIRTSVIEDACRGVDLKPGDSAAAITQMRQVGVSIVDSTEIVRRMNHR